jgi:hypothetical protein
MDTVLASKVGGQRGRPGEAKHASSRVEHNAKLDGRDSQRDRKGFRKREQRAEEL